MTLPPRSGSPALAVESGQRREFGAQLIALRKPYSKYN